MGGVHARQQDGGEPAVAQHGGVDHDTHHHGDDESHDAQGERPDAVLAEVAHVHLQSRQEHQVDKPHVGEKVEGAVLGQDVQPIGTHQHARQHHARYVGDAQLAHHDRGYQDDGQHDEKLHHGVSDGEGEHG